MDRHLYFLPDNDVTRSLCGAPLSLTSVVRMTTTNVNCPDCLSKIDSLRGAA